MTFVVSTYPEQVSVPLGHLTCFRSHALLSKVCDDLTTKVVVASRYEVNSLRYKQKQTRCREKVHHNANCNAPNGSTNHFICVWQSVCKNKTYKQHVESLCEHATNHLTVFKSAGCKHYSYFQDKYRHQIWQLTKTKVVHNSNNNKCGEKRSWPTSTNTRHYFATI